MFQHILVPLDGSPRAEQALAVAAQLARASRGTLVLLRAVMPSHALLPALAWESVVPQSTLERELEEARGYLEEVASSTLLSGIRVETQVAAGQAAPVIWAAVAAREVDLIVICSHGYTGFKRWALGSVAEQVVHQASVPILLLREGEVIPVFAPPQREGPLRVLVPLDGSVDAKAAIAPAADLIAKLSAPRPGALHLLRVIALPPVNQIGVSRREAMLHRAKHYLQNTVKHLQEGLVAPSVAPLNLCITWSVTIDDDIAAGIIRVAENGEDAAGAGVFGGCDVIAMATHGYSGLQRWAMGSITDRVLSATRLPMLIVHSSMKEMEYRMSPASQVDGERR
jgi:nucleotide-binding universal stress UspA family protein